MAFEDYTINQFKKAWFSNDRTVMTDEIFNSVYTEYVDAAGLFLTDEFEKVSYIHYINGRINSVKLSLKLQRQFLDEFDLPYVEDFIRFNKKYGHRLFWNGNKEAFLKALTLIEDREKKYITILENKIKELKDERLKHNRGEVPEKQKREGFIRLLISLGKIGYRIDNDKTTVEELALMIKQQTEETEAIKRK